MVKVPEYCLDCGAEYAGGNERIGNPIKEGSIVFYKCGASMSVKTSSDGFCQILFKNCLATEKGELNGNV